MSSKSQVSVDNFLCQLFVFFYDQALTLKIDLCFIYDIILANEQKDVLIGTYPYLGFGFWSMLFYLQYNPLFFSTNEILILFSP